MKIRSIDGSRDWMFGKGLQSYKYQNNAIAENIETRIMSFLNDCWFDMDAGIDWLNLLGSHGTQTRIELLVRAMILQSYGVKKCNRIDTNFNRTSRHLVLTYNIDTIFSTNVEGEVAI